MMLSMFEQGLFYRGSLHGMVADMLNSIIIESKFEIQSHYYIHFWINAFRKDMNL